MQVIYQLFLISSADYDRSELCRICLGIILQGLSSFQMVNDVVYFVRFWEGGLLLVVASGFEYMWNIF
jgi:hypothetical protein